MFKYRIYSVCKDFKWCIPMLKFYEKILITKKTTTTCRSEITESDVYFDNEYGSVF